MRIRALDTRWIVLSGPGHSPLPSSPSGRNIEYDCITSGGSSLVGKTISHYKILEKLGQGGMGEVYRATDTKLNRGVAIQILAEHLSKRGSQLSQRRILC